MECKKCKGSKVVKAGFVRGCQRYKCKDCGYYFTDTPPRAHPLNEKLLSFQLYASDLYLGRIGYLLQVSQVTIQKWLQKLVPELYPQA